VSTVAIVLKPLKRGWAVALTDGRELARFTGPLRAVAPSATSPMCWGRCAAPADRRRARRALTGPPL
jgi:hypothetical protein